MPQLTLSIYQERLVATEALCDPRTLRRFLEGREVRPSVAERIRRAMQKHGLGAEAR